MDSEWAVSTPPTQLVVVFVLGLVVFKWFVIDVIRQLVRDRAERKGRPLPPGPKPLPFLGSALSVNAKEPFRTYTEWRRKYGDIVYARLLDMDVVIVNTPAVAEELFEKRWQTYSNRPFVETAKPYGHEINFFFAQYGEYWEICRRIFHQTFDTKAVDSFRPLQHRKARQLVLDVLNNPSDYKTHYTTFASALTMCSIYDYDPSPKNDGVLSIVNKFVETAFPALEPGKVLLIKAFPFLLNLPEWLPWPSISREARNARVWSAKTVEVPYQHVKRRLASKEDVKPSMVADQIARMAKFDDAYRFRYEKVLKEASATAFLGSVETTTLFLMTFTLAMVKNPRIWKHAQEQIDAVVGTNRLPGFDDRPKLPYVDAILRETLRWQPPAPLGAPRATTQSNIYNGFYIPKGATIFGNVWGMSRDETRYPNAEEFVPERFLDAKGELTNDVPDFVYGFGRRICPGRHAANSSVWICMATMLAALDFNPAKDEKGKDIEFEPEFLGGLARRLLTFPCRITPRAHVSKTAIERTLAK